MVEPKKLTVQARDRKLQEHAQAIQATLKDQGLLDALDGSYPGISSISVERGKAFGLMGFDESSGTLRVQVNPSSPKQTRQQFAGLGKKLASKPRASLSVKPAVDLDLSFASPPAGPRSYTHRGLTFKPVDVPEDVLNAQAYSGAFKIPSRASIQDAHDQYFVASFIASDGSSRLTSQGIPIMDQQEANIMRVRRTSTGSLMGYPFRQDSDSDSITVPVLGDFYSGGGKITDRLEEEGVIERVRHDGKQLTTAVYVKTARQLYLPVSGSIQMINIGGRRIIPNSYEALSQAWELMSDGQTAGGMATDSLAKLTDDALEAAYQQKPEGTLEQFKAKNIDSYGVEVGMLSLQEALEKPEKARQLGLDTSKLAIEQARVCGVGIKGAGCLGYDGCYLDHKRGDPLPDGFRLHSQDDDETAYGVYETYYHARGLVLPVAHQQDAGTPVGAVTPVDRLSFDRENLLLKRGCALLYHLCCYTSCHKRARTRYGMR